MDLGLAAPSRESPKQDAARMAALNRDQQAELDEGARLTRLFEVLLVNPVRRLPVDGLYLDMRQPQHKIVTERPGWCSTIEKINERLTQVFDNGRDAAALRGHYDALKEAAAKDFANGGSKKQTERTTEVAATVTDSLARADLIEFFTMHFRDEEMSNLNAGAMARSDRPALIQLQWILAALKPEAQPSPAGSQQTLGELELPNVHIALTPNE